MEPVLSEPEPVAAVLRELWLWRILGQHTGGHKHTVAGAGASRGPCQLLLLAPALAPPPLWVLWCWGQSYPRACLPLAHIFQKASPFKQEQWFFLLSLSPLPSPLPAFLTTEASPLITQRGRSDLGRPCPSAPPHPALAPWLPRLMQLVVNSSRSCFTVYFSGFKKKIQKL